MGTVWRALDSRLNREVALKVLHAGIQDSGPQASALSREARAMAAVEHPGIVPIYELQLDSEPPFMAMRLMLGGTLAERLAAGPLELDEVVRVATQVAGALDSIHARGLTHADVKPSNILFDERGNAYLSDFGIAYAASGSLTLPAPTAAGAAHYMSPERILHGGKPQSSWDLYGLAMSCYEALAGRPAFQGDWNAVMSQQLHAPTPPVTDFVPTIAAGCVAALATALAKDPSERFESGAHFVADLAAERPPLSVRTVVGPPRPGVIKWLRTRDPDRMALGVTIWAITVGYLLQHFHIVDLGLPYSLRGLVESRWNNIKSIVGG